MIKRRFTACAATALQLLPLPLLPVPPLATRIVILAGDDSVVIAIGAYRRHHITQRSPLAGPCRRYSAALCPRFAACS
jgi:hypothetical protein|eukprot:COSAG06_NODE_3022_length_5949_cov_8.542051_3_plen_78_part_00